MKSTRGGQIKAWVFGVELEPAAPARMAWSWDQPLQRRSQQLPRRRGPQFKAFGEADEFCQVNVAKRQGRVCQYQCDDGPASMVGVWAPA